MSEFWKSTARVHRHAQEADVAEVIGEGPLARMVEMFLAEPEEQRGYLTLTGDAVEGALGLEAVRGLHRREDFPGAY